jgi:hypothetical protein
MKRNIPVQTASPEHIVLIDKKIKASKYNDIKDIINSFSERNIFNDNGKINYSNYNMFIYDYDSIEEELGNIILPGVCLFENEKKLNFIIYWSEGFRGGNSDIISKFYYKYKQKDLTKGEKEKIKEYIIKTNLEKMKIYGVKKDFKNIFISLQMLLFLLTEYLISKEDEKIYSVIENAPQYFKISEDCKEFFNKEGKNISISKLMNLFFIFEHICFDDLNKSLLFDLKIEIDENIKNKIREKLIYNYNNKIYTLKELSAALRRFISRYLVGFTQTVDIQNNRNLDYELSRPELWEKKIWENNDLEDILPDHIGEFKLKVKHAYEFYGLIGGEDMKEIQFLNE